MKISDFQELLANRLGVPVNVQELLAGFPPKPVQVCSAAHLMTLSSMLDALPQQLSTRQCISSSAHASNESHCLPYTLAMVCFASQP